MGSPMGKKPQMLSRQNLTVEQAVEKPKVESMPVAAAQAQTRGGKGAARAPSAAVTAAPMAARRQAIRGAKGRR